MASLDLVSRLVDEASQMGTRNYQDLYKIATMSWLIESIHGICTLLRFVLLYLRLIDTQLGDGGDVGKQACISSSLSKKFQIR